jgi:hypothetical protein
MDELGIIITTHYPRQLPELIHFSDHGYPGRTPSAPIGFVNIEPPLPNMRIQFMEGTDGALNIYWVRRDLA